MEFEKLAKKLIEKFEKPVYDYHYNGKVIYPEDALEMIRELCEKLGVEEEDLPE